MRSQRRLWLFLWSGLVLCSCSPNGKGSPASPAERAPALEWRETPEPVEAAPISLTASDGTGLNLVSLTARTVIQEPLALTELHLTFHNPENRVREGRFAITLPTEAAISRFAMRVGEQWQEGEVVERKRAQTIYEDYLHRKQDPALLEQDAGNQFTARVFPIAAGEHKQLIVTYSEELGHSTEPYRLLLKGLPRLSQLSVEIQVDQGEYGASRLVLNERDHVPSADLAVALAQLPNITRRSGNLTVTRVAARTKGEAEPIDGLSILFDTSASRALSFEAQLERLGALLAELKTQQDRDFPVQIIAFDQSPELMYEGPVSGFSTRDKANLLAREALGASNLGAALSALGSQVAPKSRILIVSDGVITAGQENTTALREAVARLSAHGVRRIDALAEGGLRDEATLSALTRSGLKSTGLVLDSRLTIPTLASKLGRATLERVRVTVPGASWSYPDALEGVQDGDEFLVFAELPQAAPLRVELQGLEPVTPELRVGSELLLERSVARAKIAAMEAQLRSAPAGMLAYEISKLSIQHRVLSSQTALLVLETPEEYVRYGISPEARTNILAVAEEGITTLQRARTRLQRPAPDPEEIAKNAPSRAAREETAAHEELPTMPALAPRPTEAPPPAPPAPSADIGNAREEASAAAEAKAAAAKAAAPTPAKQSAAQSVARPGVAEAAAEALLLDGLGSGKKGALSDVLAGGAVTGNAAEVLAQASGSGVATGGSGGTVRAGSGGVGGIGTDDVDRLGALPKPVTGSTSSMTVDVQASARLHRAVGLDSTETGRIIRQLNTPARSCFTRVAAQDTSITRLSMRLEFTVADTGSVSDVFISAGNVPNDSFRACVLSAARHLRFPKPEGTMTASVEAGIDFSTRMRPIVEPVATPVVAPRPAAPKPVLAAPVPALSDAYDGILLSTFEALSKGNLEAARREAEAARLKAPGGVIALIALGEVLEAQQDYARAARVYGSIIDLFPSRTDLRRMAGARLERLPEAVGLELATDSYQKALLQRADHPSGHRLLAYALLKQRKYQEAFSVVTYALTQDFRWDRFAGATEILREDLGLIASAWLRAEPSRTSDVQTVLKRFSATLDTKPSLRFVLNWETDANDVDFHIYDGRGGHAYYLQRALPSGGKLYNDIIRGYGPECFTIPGTKRAFPYTLQAHYFARGPMGYGMGKVQVVDHDGKGNLSFAEHPFTIMKDKAFVRLAVVQSAPRASTEALTLGTQ